VAALTDAPRPPRASPRPAGRRFSAGGLAAAVLVLLAAAICVRLGVWQLDRLEQRRARNAALATALAQPPVVLDAGTAAALAREPAAALYRRVRVRGVYRPDGEVVLRGRSYQGQPGVHLLTPLVLAEGGPAVLVERGWVPAADAATIDPAPLGEPGVQEVEGMLQLFPPAAGQGVPATLEAGGRRLLTLRRLDTAALDAYSPVPLLPFYVQQLPDPALREPPVRLAPPPLDDGPHLSYALQWFGFAAVFLIGLAVLALRRAR
jgi:surfeit locus 1 family protein